MKEKEREKFPDDSDGEKSYDWWEDDDESNDNGFAHMHRIIRVHENSICVLFESN